MEVVNLEQDPTKLKRISRMLKTIGHPSRLRIIELLLLGSKLSVKDIYERINISQSSASQHLRSLEEIGILQSEREGKQIFYSILNHHIRQLLHCVQACSDC